MKHQRLSFPWIGYSGASFTLLGFILVSLALHALAFYAFQIAYPSGATVAPPPAQVTLLSPSGEENRLLLNWIEAENPALIARTGGYLPRTLLESNYRASFDQPGKLPSLSEGQNHDAVPAGLTLATLFRKTFTAPQPSSLPASGSRVLFFGNLKQPPLELELKSKSSAKLTPARYLMGVSHEGRLNYLFKEETSGDPNLDAEVETQLWELTFPKADEGFTWGHAVTVWGKEVQSKP